MPYKFDFFNPDDSVKLEWVSDAAKDFAIELSQSKSKNQMRNPRGQIVEEALSSSQLRNFYNEFIRIRELPKAANEKYALIKLIEAKVRYKKTSNRRFKKCFVDFLSDLIKQIGTSSIRFNNACMIMEAVVGFFPKK